MFLASLKWSALEKLARHPLALATRGWATAATEGGGMHERSRENVPRFDQVQILKKGETISLEGAAACD